jgi:putative transposase
MVVFRATIPARGPFMVQSTSAVAFRAEGKGMRIVSSTSPRLERFAKHPIPSLSREAKARLRWFDYYERCGRNASLTCRYFGISRPTFYRWHARYNPRDLTSLEDRPSRPRRKRPKSWTTKEIEAVLALRQAYPRWGKDKLAILLSARGTVLSVSRVGRILGYLKSRGVLREPVRSAKARARTWARPYGVRKPQGYAAQAPGDLVQLDSLDVRPAYGIVMKQFTARDLVSRYDVLTLAGRATARTAVSALEAITARMPFPVRAIQVDGGAEFMAEFEEACKVRGVRLFVLPPRSPKLNGAVERANRTHTEEFHDFSLAAPTVAELGVELAAWERIYNTVRPHQALGYLTPKQFLDRWNQEHARKEV